MFNFKKKGQEGTGAAILVIIIAVAILLYILFLPPDERARILNEDGTGTSDSTLTHDLDGKILLSEKPGRLDSLKQDEFSHDISSFTLFSSTESGVIREIDSALVTRSVFTAKDFEFEFEIMEKDNMDNFLLSFTKTEGSGVLTITLNDKVLSERFIESSSPAPIKIPKDYLVDGNNKLIFSVSSPGILFFMTNRYNLENIKIFADTTDNNALTSVHQFVVDDIEYQNIEDAKMVFYIDCMGEERGKLNIKLNQYQIYDSAADCGSPVKIDVNPAYLRNGDNLVSFEADRGRYVIDQFKITTDLREPLYPVYYFEITDEELELIEDDEIGINLSMRFVDRDEYNQVELNINNRKITVETIKNYNEEIDLFVQEENNFIKITPVQDTIDLADMTIFYWDKD